jgi:hypothetical protein
MFNRQYHDQNRFTREYSQKNINTSNGHLTPFPFKKPSFYSTINQYDINKNRNNNIKQCNICLKYNHTEEECYFKNKSNVICQLCNKFSHSAIRCHSNINNTNNQKN